MEMSTLGYWPPSLATQGRMSGWCLSSLVSGDSDGVMAVSIAWLVSVETQPLFINTTADELIWVDGEPRVNEYFTGEMIKMGLGTTHTFNMNSVIGNISC